MKKQPKVEQNTWSKRNHKPCEGYYYEFNVADAVVRIDVKRKYTNYLAGYQKDFYTGSVRFKGKRKKHLTEEFGLLKDCKEATVELYQELQAS